MFEFIQNVYQNIYKYNLNKTHQNKLKVWFHPWLCMIFRIIHNRPKFYFDLYCVTLLQIFCTNAHIEHFHTLEYFRILFVACDGRRRGDLNVQNQFTRDRPKNSGQNMLLATWIVIPSLAKWNGVSTSASLFINRFANSS